MAHIGRIDKYGAVRVQCGWCGYEVNPAIPGGFIKTPRIGVIGFHFSCIEGLETAARTLALNLAVAGGLCASFEMGRDAGPDDHMPFVTSRWRPGCGKPWTWPHITRDYVPSALAQGAEERKAAERGMKRGGRR